MTINGGAAMPSWYDITSLDERDENREDRQGQHTTWEHLVQKRSFSVFLKLKKFKRQNNLGEKKISKKPITLDRIIFCLFCEVFSIKITKFSLFSNLADLCLF